jgi:hypothetical protein
MHMTLNRQTTALLTKVNRDAHLFRFALFGTLAAVVCLCAVGNFRESDNLLLSLSQNPEPASQEGPGRMIYWNDFEHFPLHNGDTPVYHDGWRQRRFMTSAA